MSMLKQRNMKLWLMIAFAVFFLTAGSVFNRNLSASSDETYKSLKVFSDVLDIVEKNYVDEVDPKELIQKAIQGMVQSLDPHSVVLPPDAFEDLKIDTKIILLI